MQKYSPLHLLHDLIEFLASPQGYAVIVFFVALGYYWFDYRVRNKRKPPDE